ncbi:MAG TPA: DUF350 domain-containing protein [Symbiobacteriaceae bacterium]|nr:DUF350 domain-containing protein [Symbiobacteriaceae bacterium]
MLNQGWVQAIIYYLVALAAGGVGLFLFQKLTHFDDWKEIGKGNVAAALASGGQILGLAVVIHAAVISNQSVLMTLMWTGIGFVMQVLGYFVFDVFTPFKNEQEIARGNVAVGAMSAIITVAVAYVVAAVIQ